MFRLSRARALYGYLMVNQERQGEAIEVGEEREDEEDWRREEGREGEEIEPLKQTQHAQLDLCAFECALLLLG